MAECDNHVQKKLIGLLGPENILSGEELIIVKPASAEETASVLQLAHRENLGVGHYLTRPPAHPDRKIRVLLSLERMDRIRFYDRENSCLLADPAVPVSRIAGLAAAAGRYFPGEACPHIKGTVGESIAECFQSGRPEFACAAACLCGLEMVLPDGEIVTSGGEYLKDVSNYDLTYILSGYPENRAVVTGVYLRLLSPAPAERFLLAPFAGLEDFLAVLPSLSGCGSHLQGFTGVAWSTSGAGKLSALFPELKETGAYVLLIFKGDPDGLEPALREAAELCNPRTAGELLVASTPHQQESLSTAFHTLLEDLRNEDPSQIILGGPDEWSDLKLSPGIKALVWRKDTAR